MEDDQDMMEDKPRLSLSPLSLTLPPLNTYNRGATTVVVRRMEVTVAPGTPLSVTVTVCVSQGRTRHWYWEVWCQLVEVDARCEVIYYVKIVDL